MSLARVIGLVVLVGPACSDLPCRSATDCPLGFFCRFEGQSGQCDFECLEARDCPAPSDPTQRAVCRNDGRCGTATRSPRIEITEPVEGQVLEPNQRELRVTGSVESEAATIDVELQTEGAGGCGGTLDRFTIDHPEPGVRLAIPFLREVFLPPQTTGLSVQAVVRDALQRVPVRLSGSCPDCPLVRIEEPTLGMAQSSLVLPRLVGSIQPPVDTVGTWRISDGTGQVFDGPLPVVGGRYEVRRLPLFGGQNRIEVLLDQRGSRCAATVFAPLGSPGLRVLLTWDSDADFDLLLVQPEVPISDPSRILSPSSPQAFGRVEDDFDGFGPESLTTEPLGPGVYGVAVEALSGSPGAAFLRVLVDGELRTVPGLGPRFLSPRRAEVWLAARLAVDEEGAVEVEFVDVVTPDREPLVPAEWPGRF
jgi:hypothetical protein